MTGGPFPAMSFGVEVDIITQELNLRSPGVHLVTTVSATAAAPLLRFRSCGSVIEASVGRRTLATRPSDVVRTSVKIFTSGVKSDPLHRLV